MYTGIRSVYRDQIRLPVSDPYTGIRSVYRYPIGKINSEPDVDSDSQLTAKYFQLFVIFLLRIRNRTSKSEPDLDKSHPDLDNTGPSPACSLLNSCLVILAGMMSGASFSSSMANPVAIQTLVRSESKTAI